MENKQTSSAYTPGPWKWLNHSEIVVDDAHETFIAEVFDEHEEWRANARLIAAAPELLKACEQQHANWRMLESGAWDGHPEGIQVVIDCLESIIARAYGTRS
jgi:hypothetical protein